MKNRINNVRYIICIIAGISFLLTGCFYYTAYCKNTSRDTSASPDGKYELMLIEIGEPAWPFGPASGRLVLNEGDTEISQADFSLANDGCSISSNDWTVAWGDDHVEVILSGEEQFDEQILLYFDGSVERQYLREETIPITEETEPKIITLDIAVLENRENELVFNISIDDYIDCYNQFFMIDQGRSYLLPSVRWQSYPYDSAIHSEHKTYLYYFTEDERVYTLPTITVYVPSNGDYIQEITVNFDEHSYSESGFEQYKEMCFYTVKVFFPDLSDEQILDLCTEIITVGNQNVFTSDAWYSSDSVPCALYYKDGIGIYPYFAIGDWEHFCIIPVTDETIAEFEQKGVEVYEIK